MDYGKESITSLPAGFDASKFSAKNLEKIFKNGAVMSEFSKSESGSFIGPSEQAVGLLEKSYKTPNTLSMNLLTGFKVDNDCMIEITNTSLTKPVALRNQLSDLMSFQFVSNIKRSEFIGNEKHTHDMGPAIIVSVVSDPEITYRIPKLNSSLRNVVVYTTLSNLMVRMGEDKNTYPVWLQSILDGDNDKPQQRVFFLEDIHRDLTWACFNIPVTGMLLNQWMTSKFYELLCVGLETLKNNHTVVGQDPSVQTYRHGEQVRKARAILNSEYAHPPSVPALARQLGMSETQLKNGFKTIIGTTIGQYCINNRIVAARLLLLESSHSISEIGDIVGYEDHSAFSRAFRRITGSTPHEFRNTQ